MELHSTSREVTADIAKVERRLARLGDAHEEETLDRWAEKCWRLYAGVLIKADREVTQ